MIGLLSMILAVNLVIGGMFVVIALYIIKEYRRKKEENRKYVENLMSPYGKSRKKGDL